MDPKQQPPHPPVESSFSWHDRLLHWSGWEQMVVYRWQLIGSTVVFVALVWLLGWWFARSESSSIAQTLRAELIVQRLRNPESTSEAVTTSSQQDLQKLKALSPIGTTLATRFSGVIAEEEVLQHVQPISQERFSIAFDNLYQANLPLEGAIVQATQLTEEGKTDEALHLIDETIDKSFVECPQTHAYALLQKATLLKDQKKGNGDVIHELEQFLTSHPDVESSFDLVFSGNTRDALAFLKTE